MENASERYTDYKMFGDDGSPAAGICHARGVNLGLPPIWMIHFPVGDLAESVRRVQEEGGKSSRRHGGTTGGGTHVQ
jgi:uncharacterized protein